MYMCIYGCATILKDNIFLVSCALTMWAKKILNLLVFLAFLYMFGSSSCIDEVLCIGTPNRERDALLDMLLPSRPACIQSKKDALCLWLNVFHLNMGLPSKSFVFGVPDVRTATKVNDSRMQPRKECVAEISIIYLSYCLDFMSLRGGRRIFLL